MKRVLIIGCGGSGKSTLARAMGERTGLPVIHMDKLFWKPGWVSMEKDEFDALIRERMKEEEWILDGNYRRTLPERIACCDTVIYLDLPRIVCLMGAVKRILRSYGTVRSDMAEGCPERIDAEFFGWVWNYNKVNRANNYALLKNAPLAKVIILKNRREVSRFLRKL